MQQVTFLSAELGTNKAFMWKCLHQFRLERLSHSPFLLYSTCIQDIIQTAQHYYNSILHMSDLIYKEYAVPVWDPHQQGHINSLEKVQKFALKVCTGKWNVDYDSLLNSCKLPTLVTRRQYLKLSFLYQVQLYFSQCTT